MDIRSRIFELVDKKYKEQQTFAAALGVSTTMVSAWRKNKSESYMKRIPQIAELLGTTTEYLLTGSSEKSSNWDDGLSAEERILMTEFRQLTPEQQEMVIRMVKAAADKL